LQPLRRYTHTACGVSEVPLNVGHALKSNCVSEFVIECRVTPRKTATSYFEGAVDLFTRGLGTHIHIYAYMESLWYLVSRLDRRGLQRRERCSFPGEASWLKSNW
jgi:hypothetical protein